jgi:integrase
MQDPSYASPIPVDRAVDRYLGKLDRDGLQPSTLRSYEYELRHFLRMLPREYLTSQLTEDDYERFLDRWRGKARSTRASKVSLVRGFSSYLYAKRWASTDVVADAGEAIRRPRRLNAVEVGPPSGVSVSSEDVVRLFNACETMQELICLGAAASMGRRRTALAEARRSDADLDNGFIRFTDKGQKVIEQPIPDEFLAVLRAADEDGIWASPDDYLIPNRRPSIAKKNGRQSKVIYETVVKVAQRAGVRCHVHALRAAFAVQFLQSPDGTLEATQELLGHTRPDTTMIYLRRMNRAAAMENVRGLSWASPGSNPVARQAASLSQKAHTGFEPVSAKSAGGKRKKSNLVSSDPLRERLGELRAASRTIQRRRKTVARR